MKQIFCTTSQNGRWGLALVSEGFEEWPGVAQATLLKVGEIEGKTVYRVEPTEEPTWVWCKRKDAVVLVGGDTIEDMGLQGGDNVSLLYLSSQAIIKWWGYARRSSYVEYWENGEQMRVPASVLLALGAVPTKTTPEPVPSPTLFNLDGMSEEMRGSLLNGFAKI